MLTKEEKRAIRDVVKRYGREKAREILANRKRDRLTIMKLEYLNRLYSV